MERLKWLEDAVFLYIEKHENCGMLAVTAHFGELRVDKTLFSLKRLVTDGRIEQSQYTIDQTYHVLPVKKESYLEGFDESNSVVVCLLPKRKIIYGRYRSLITLCSSNYVIHRS